MKIVRLQAIKALKEEGIDTVVINPNVATVQVKQYMQNQPNMLNRYYLFKHRGVLCDF